jgi:DNA gyrase subunit A
MAMRMVIELKRDASGDVVLNQLWRSHAMQSSFGVNMLALNGGRPELDEPARHPASFPGVPGGSRQSAASKFELAKARDRGHVLVGLAVAVANIDEVIHIIRSGRSVRGARAARPRA